MKKISVLLFVFCLVLSMSTLSFAAEDESSSEPDSAQEFIDSLNNGTLENAGGILDGSLEELPDVSQFSNFSDFLAASMAWIPAGWWFVFRLCLVMLVARVVMGFLWR